MRLLCDEMLGRLGRWLRAAGCDTAIAEPGAADAALLDRCLAENRLLLTRDRHLAAVAPASVPVLCLASARLDDQARELRRGFGVDWLKAPFTRCLADNAPLDPAPPDMAAAVPAASRAAGGPLHVCPACGRLYWPGGHVRRMQARLSRWNRGEPGVSL